MSVAVTSELGSDELGDPLSAQHLSKSPTLTVANDTKSCLLIHKIEGSSRVSFQEAPTAQYLRTSLNCSWTILLSVVANTSSRCVVQPEIHRASKTTT